MRRVFVTKSYMRAFGLRYECGEEHPLDTIYRLLEDKGYDVHHEGEYILKVTTVYELKRNDIILIAEQHMKRLGDQLVHHEETREKMLNGELILCCNIFNVPAVENYEKWVSEYMREQIVC